VSDRKFRILAVDDDRFSLDILQTDLEEGGFEVICAGNASMALERLGDTAGIDAVVLDHMMPGMDGIALLRKLKTSSHFCGIPVIMHSSNYQRQNRLEGIQAGAFDYLIKPYDEKRLVRTIETAIKGEMLEQEG